MEALRTDTQHVARTHTPQPGNPEEGVRMRIFETWMPDHPVFLVTHKAICDQACARLVGVLASGALSPETGGPRRWAQAGGLG